MKAKSKSAQKLWIWGSWVPTAKTVSIMGFFRSLAGFLNYFLRIYSGLNWAVNTTLKILFFLRTVLFSISLFSEANVGLLIILCSRNPWKKTFKLYPVQHFLYFRTVSFTRPSTSEIQQNSIISYFLFIPLFTSRKKIEN